MSRNYLFAGSHDVARRAATLYSLIRTCAQHDVPPLTYLTDVLRKLAAGWPNGRLEELLFDRWQLLHANRASRPPESATTTRAPFRVAKGAIRLHTLLDLRGNIPTCIHITDGLVHDVNVLDLLIPEVGAICILDRGYIDSLVCMYFTEQLPPSLHAPRRCFASAPLFTRSRSHNRLICDQTVVLTLYKSRLTIPTS